MICISPLKGWSGHVFRLLSGEECGVKSIALLMGSAVNQDGRSSSLTAPNGPSQQQASPRGIPLKAQSEVDNSVSKRTR